VSVRDVPIEAFQTRAIYLELIERALDAPMPLPPSLRETLAGACIRLMDARMIVDDSCATFSRRPAEIASSLVVPAELVEPIAGIVDGVRKEGLRPHFEPLMRKFARIMFNLFTSAAQYERVRGWVDQGMVSAFLMTDAGGPQLESWRSEVTSRDGQALVRIDKITAMKAERFGFAIVVVRAGTTPFPHMYLVSPEECAKLRRRPWGRSFLDGVIQLGDVDGTVQVGAEDRIVRGGVTTTNHLLTLVRPLFVRALMAHVQFLGRCGRVMLSAAEHEALGAIARVGEDIAARGSYSNLAVARALALKLCSNELLTSLVAQGKVRSREDEYDLLAFSKMEGSSYRCFHEVYVRSLACNRPKPSHQPA